MKVNNYMRIIMLLAMLGSTQACEVIDTAPAQRIPEEEAFTDATRIGRIVIGAYEAAQRGWYLGAVDRGYPFGAAAIQQGDMRGEDMYNDQLFYEVTYTNAWTPTTANNNGMWIALYRLINRCNVVLQGLQGAVQNGVITEEIGNRYRGEMLFLRALSHHELLIHFSRPYADDPSLPGVPYRDVAIDDIQLFEAALQIPRGTVTETYARILQDLDEAELLLTGAPGRPFRATQGAAIALKTRVKLHMQDWTGVLDEYAKISTAYALAESPEQPFRVDASPENIFFLQHSDASNPGVNAGLASMYGNPAFQGRGLVKISPVIWTAPFWETNDLRRQLLTSSSSIGVFTTKYDAYSTYDDPTPVIRFAEVVLNAAEAYARTNQLDEAVTLVNRVRGRALPGGAPLTVGGLGGDVTGVLQAVLNERRIEFLAEGRRWSDIHRLSGEGVLEGVPPKAPSRSVTTIDLYQPGALTARSHSLPYTSHLFVWPLPIDEVVNNPLMAEQQNPGY